MEFSALFQVLTKYFKVLLCFVTFDPIESKIIAYYKKNSLKILVTGGAGFIGRNLVKSFLKNNTIRIFDNLSNSSKEKISSMIENGVDFVNGDILDYETLVQSCKGYDVVIHLAAKTDVRESILHPEITNKVNVTGTINVLKSCIENKIKKIIFASSAAVYGDCKELPISEKSKTNPLSPYGISKLKAEEQIQMFSEKFKMCGICLRIFNVYGKGQNEQYAGVISKFIKNISKDKPIIINGDGTQTRDFVSISDVVNSFHHAIKLTKSATYNIASGKETSINELVKKLITINGKKIKIKFTDNKNEEIKNSLADISLAQKELGFEPKIELEKGLVDLISISN